MQYMSPEVMSGEAYSFEVDFWALGVMLHEIITGHTIGLPMEPEVRTGELGRSRGPSGWTGSPSATAAKRR